MINAIKKMYRLTTLIIINAENSCTEILKKIKQYIYLNSLFAIEIRKLSHLISVPLLNKIINFFKKIIQIFSLNYLFYILSY